MQVKIISARKEQWKQLAALREEIARPVESDKWHVGNCSATLELHTKEPEKWSLVLRGFLSDGRALIVVSGFTRESVIESAVEVMDDWLRTGRLAGGSIVDSHDGSE